MVQSNFVFALCSPIWPQRPQRSSIPVSRRRSSTHWPTATAARSRCSSSRTRRCWSSNGGYATTILTQGVAGPMDQRDIDFARTPAALGQRLAHRLALLEILANRVAAHSHLGCYRANRAPFYKNLLSNNMYLAHPEHPSSGEILILGRSKISRFWAQGGSLLKRRMDHFSSGVNMRLLRLVRWRHSFYCQLQKCPTLIQSYLATRAFRHRRHLIRRLAQPFSVAPYRSACCRSAR